MAHKYQDKQLARAKENKLALFIWEMDKRYVTDEEDRCHIRMSGTMSAEKASRIFRLLQEDEPLPAPPDEKENDGTT